MKSSESKVNLNVRAELMKKGYSIAEWARSNGFNPMTASRYLQRWGGKDTRPRGAETNKVITQLEIFIGFKICG